jgi:hypothetical protein
MMELLRILFFANSVLLTPSPINIHQGGDVEFSSPVSAISSGAAIHVDVSAMVPLGARQDIISSRRWVGSQFPRGSIVATIGCGGCPKGVEFSFDGDISWSKGGVELMLTSKTGVPTDVEFNKINLHSDVELHQISIKWFNYMK